MIKCFMGYKRFLFISILILLASNCVYHYKVERDIKSIKIGDSRTKVESILGVSNVESTLTTIDVIRKGQLKDPDEPIAFHYRGHACFFFCPTPFEDYLNISYDDDNRVYKIKRYGL